MKFVSALKLGTMIAGMAAVSSSAFAQGIEIVTVTAAKREQNVQDVPISMNVFSQKDLEKFAPTDLKDIAAQVPGLTINRGQTVNSLYLRGFGTGAGTNPALDQTVSLYVDGVYSGRAREYMAPLFDVQRLEVLRGPQGSLLGKNTAAGALSIVTNNPTDEFEFGATVGYMIDRTSGIDAFGYISGPVMDTLKARLALKIVDRDGYLYNMQTGKSDPQNQSQSGRLTLEWDPSERFHMVTKYQFDHTDQTGRLTVGRVPNTTTAAWRQSLPGFVTNNTPMPGELGDMDNSNAHHFSNLIELDMGDLTFVSQSGVTAFTSRSVAGALHHPVETVTTDYRDSFVQYAQEFRVLSSTGNTFDWIVGAYVDWSKYRVDNTFRYRFFPTAAFNGAIFFTQTTTQLSLSAYATGTWNITDDFRLIAGVRGTTIDRDGDYNRFTAFGAAFPGSGPLAIPVTNKTESSFDPAITIQYDLTDEIKAYASWAKGSKGGAFQATRSTTAASFYVKPEQSEAWDVGVKSKLWDFLTVNLAGFYMKFKSLQVSQFVVLTAGFPPTLTSTNAATAESKGVELVLQADLNEWVEGLNFSLSGAYTDNRFTDYPGAPCTFASTLPAGGGCGTVAPPGSLVPVAGTLGTGPNAGRLFNGAGLSTNGAPQWTGTFAVNYVRNLDDTLKLDLTVGGDMQSHSWMDGGVYNANFGLQPSYTKFNFRIAVGDPDDMWTIAFLGTNVFDVLSSSGTYTFPPAQVYSIDEGRRFTIQGSVKLN